MEKELFSHSATIFSASNMSKSIAFYTKKLGFKLMFEWEDPVTYAVLKRGEVSIHLSKSEDGQPMPTSPRTALYIFVHDVDKVYEELKSEGTEIHSEIADQDYQMRDFDVKDPDGYIICFGQGLEE